MIEMGTMVIILLSLALLCALVGTWLYYAGTVCPHCYEAGHMVCVRECYHLTTTKAERDARWEENQRQMYARKKKRQE